MMIINGLRCSKCGDPELIAVWPCDTADQFDLFVMTPQRPLKCWCEACWIKDFAQVAPLQRRGKAKAEAIAHK